MIISMILTTPFVSQDCESLDGFAHASSTKQKGINQANKMVGKIQTKVEKTRPPTS